VTNSSRPHDLINAHRAAARASAAAGAIASRSAAAAAAAIDCCVAELVIHCGRRVRFSRRIDPRPTQSLATAE